MERDPATGAKTKRITGSGSIKLNAVLVGPGPDPKTVAAKTAAALVSDSQAAFVLALYGKAQSWEGLHLVLDAIEDDVGGDAALKKLRLVPSGAIKRFTSNANARSKALSGGRHAKKSYRVPPGQEMTLTDAHRVIRALVEGWLRYRASNPRTSTPSP